MPFLLDGEINDCRVLLNKKGILREALNVKNKILRQLEQLKLLHKSVFVGFVLSLGDAVKLVEQFKQRHLQGMSSAKRGRRREERQRHAEMEADTERRE